jgi:hypothetical protein
MGEGAGPVKSATPDSSVMSVACAACCVAKTARAATAIANFDFFIFCFLVNFFFLFQARRQSPNFLG